MKRFSIILIMVTFLMVFGITDSFAALMNVRPAVGAKLTPPHGEQTLGGTGGIFDTIGATTYAADPVGTQISNAIFTNQASGGAIASFIIAIAGYAPNNEVGLYKYNDPSKIVPVFRGATNADAPEHATISFFLDGTVDVYGPSISTKIVVGSYAGFGNIFGFYIKTPQGDTFYSEDDRNLGGNPQALIFRGNDLDKVQLPGFAQGTFTSHHYIVAFEDVAWTNADKDFNDMVFMVESISPVVPEPGTLILLGSGLVGLAVYGKVRVSRRKK
jgi:hypothetical protein